MYSSRTRAEGTCLSSSPEIISVGMRTLAATAALQSLASTDSPGERRTPRPHVAPTASDFIISDQHCHEAQARIDPDNQFGNPSLPGTHDTTGRSWQNCQFEKLSCTKEPARPASALYWGAAPRSQRLAARRGTKQRCPGAQLGAVIGHSPRRHRCRSNPRQGPSKRGDSSPRTVSRTYGQAGSRNVSQSPPR